jgi:hypothetical protein
MPDPVPAHAAEAPLEHRMSPDSVESRRLNALRRLYARRDAVDALIRSFEVYARTTRRGPHRCMAISGERKCS